MARRVQDPRMRWWGRLYNLEDATAHWSVDLEHEWRRHFRAITLLGDLKAQVHT